MMKKVLVVDDEATILKLLSHYLSKYYSVTTMPDGRQALLWMQEGNIPDIIVADIQMPYMDGDEFLSQIKSSGFFKNIPVIMLSALENSGERIKFLRMGARDYVVKPFNPEELYLRIKNLLA
ncbi:response regulator receiver domain-containing protein [Acetobacteroides hydrogenigenes]|uniref:Response regulator receiver domain-containing protein n=2 Tax=Acetobacteroides hydrogenigenes TaxID=979970 RepID=A0A4R2E4W2_9BACT|nr:response regulator transcription factor [Acetobacteroides hydrogenigenes]TCN61656.1 response regulator receiver domain-containing protein [Acetobacteroides hydrogenigenes]